MSFSLSNDVRLLQIVPCQILVSDDQKAVDWDMVGAGRLAFSLTTQTEIGPGAGQSRIFLHGVFLPALRLEIMVVTHDRIYGDAKRASGFAEAAGMAAIQGAAFSGIGGEFVFVGR